MTAAVIGIAALAIVLVFSAAWQTDRRYRRFERLPTHFDLRGRADAFGPRHAIVRIVPAILVSTLVSIAAIMVLVPRDMQNGDPVVGILVASVAVLSAQASTMWLLARWAADHRHS